MLWIWRWQPLETFFLGIKWFHKRLEPSKKRCRVSCSKTHWGRNLLMVGVPASWFRYRDKQYIFYSGPDCELVYLTNIEDWIEWRIFIDSVKSKLKIILHQIGGWYASIQSGQSVNLKNSYKNLEFVLCKLSWQVRSCCWDNNLS